MLAKAFIFAFSCTLVAGTHHWENIEEKHHPPQPYRFGYEVKDKEGNQYRHEEGDGHGTVKGSYGYTDDKGTYREVQYVADKNGFRAKVKTNEPGTANQDPANVKMEANPKIQEYHHGNVKADYTPGYKPQIQNYHHVNVKAGYTPIVHKIHVAPVRPVQQYQHFNSYNLNDFSPINRYSYRPSSILKFRPLSHQSNGYNRNFGRQMGGYQFHVPHYRNLQGFNSFDNIEGFGGLDGFNNDEIEKIIEELELKNKKQFEYSGGLKGLNTNDYQFSDLSDNDYKFKSLNGNDYKFKSLNDNDYKFKGLNDNEGEFRGLNDNYQFNGGLKNNDYHFKEFRNIGNHKYSSSSD